MPKPLALAVLAGSLAWSSLACAQDATTLAAQAGAAYEAKDFAKAAQLYVAAAADPAESSAAKQGNHYNAACAYARAGQPDPAFRELQAAIDAGLDDQSPAGDSDFASLHADPRWAPLVARFDAAHPGLAAIPVLQDQSLSVVRRYAAGRRAIAAGARPDDTAAYFNEYFANQAQFLGDYDEASRIYGWSKRVDDVVAAGFTHGVDAVPVVLAQARGRQAVFVNESHGQSQTRAANYALLKGLRAEGFDVLAMETLKVRATTASDPTHCANATLLDGDLPARGYALWDSGFYTPDPVYAETIREALRLGFRLVAYESAEGNAAAREQHQAENLACVFKDDPRARLVVIAGFGHIAEGKDYRMPGGVMAGRFRALSGIDPLTVDSTTQLYLDPAKLALATPPKGPRPVSFVLEDAKGTPYHTANFDLVRYVPAPSHREDGKPGWLDLGGARKATRVELPACRDVSPCIVQARRSGELAEATPADACILAAKATGCTLFLRPGRYDVVAVDESEVAVQRLPVAVSAR